MEKCTLFFKFYDKYNHENKIPLIELTLKEMDYYTCFFDSFFSLYNNLPDAIKSFIKEEKSVSFNTINENDLKNSFSIIDSNNEENYILLSNDLDVTYVTPEELVSQIVKNRIDYSDLFDCFKEKPKSINKRKYEFFAHLYETYVKDKKILGMIDTYDVKERFPMLSGDKLIISAIATDKDNIIVLTKKIGQVSKDRRNLAYEYKKSLSDINKDAKVLDENTISKRKYKLDDIDEMILKNFEKFKKDYERKYEL